MSEETKKMREHLQHQIDFADDSATWDAYPMLELLEKIEARENKIPKQMLCEIANLWHAYGYMPNQVQEIITRHMPGYTVSE